MAVNPEPDSGWVADPENDRPRPGDPIPLPGPSSGLLKIWYTNFIMLTAIPLAGIVFESRINIPGWGFSMLLLGLAIIAIGGWINFRSIAKNQQERARGYGT